MALAPGSPIPKQAANYWPRFASACSLGRGSAARAMENGDDWFALDKLYHVLFCFFIAITVAALANRTRYPFLRRWSIWFGSLVSLAAGAIKEAGDEIGLWKSAGASFKDAFADLFGILLSSIALSVFKSFSSRKKPDEMTGIRGLSMV